MAMLHMVGRMASIAQEPTIDPAEKLTSPSGSVVCHIIHSKGIFEYTCQQALFCFEYYHYVI